MPRWATFSLVALIVAVGIGGVWWQITLSSSTLRLAGHSYQVAIMRSPKQLARGLSGTTRLPINRGMLFVFAGNDIPRMWMKDMKYPIDMVWISSDYKVIYLKSRVYPSSYDSNNPEKSTIFSSDTPAKYVLELASGTIKSTGIRTGDMAKLPLGT